MIALRVGVCLGIGLVQSLLTFKREYGYEVCNLHELLYIKVWVTAFSMVFSFGDTGDPDTLPIAGPNEAF